MALLSAFRRWSPLVAYLALAGLLNTTLDGPAYAEILRHRSRLVRLDSLPAAPSAGEVSLPAPEEEVSPSAVLADLISPPPFPEDRLAGQPPRDTAATPQSLSITPEGIPLAPGWNLISLPKEPDSVDPEAVFSSISRGLVAAFTYDGCNASDPWRVHVPGAPEVSDLASVDHRVGVWVRTSEAAALAVSGAEPAETAVQLCQGWNLIGYPLSHPRPVLNALASIAGRFARVMAYDPNDAEDPWEAFDVGAPAWASDLQTMQPGRGYWVYATEDVSLRMANTGPPPEVSITAPADAATITSPTEIRGTVRSDLLESWRLEYRPKGESAFTTFASGNVPVTNAVLGSFDPTLLLNGMFEVRLTARDFAGRTASASINAVVDGGMKIGNFTLPFLDLEIPVVGIPLQVIRTYDSRDKRKGDFGYGWTLSVSDFRVEESGPSGEHWEGVRIAGLLPTYCVRPKRAHVVTITLPDGEILRFTPKVTNDCQRLLPPENVSLLYVPLPGTFATLEPIDHGSRAVVIGGFPGPVELWDESRMVLHDASRYRLTLREGTSLVVSQAEGLESIQDLNGNTVRFSKTGATHSSGAGIAFQRDSQGRIQQITDPMGYRIQYHYDDAGDLVSVRDQDGRVTRFTYLQDHYLRSIVAPDGQELVAADYDGDRRLIRTCQGNTCLSRRGDFENNREVWTDPTGRETVLSYDLMGNVTSVTEVGEPASRTTRFEYNALGLITRRIDPDGGETIFTYDPNGNKTSVVAPVPEGEDPADYTTTFRYDPRGNMTSADYPGGLGYHANYDTRGNLLELREHEGRILEMTSYRSDGTVLSEQTPFGRFLYSEIDARGNPGVMTDPAGNVLAGEYDANGRLISMVVNGGNPLTFEYDGLGRQTSAQSATGLTIGYEYKAATPAWSRFESNKTGSLRRVTDAFGHLGGLEIDGRVQTQYEYDAAGRLLVERGPLGRNVQYGYDDFGQVETITDPNGGETQFVYDPAGRPVEQTDALGNKVQFSYRVDGQIRSLTDPRGNAWNFAHTRDSVTTTDPLGRKSTTQFTKLGVPWKTVHADGTEHAVYFLRDVPLGEESDYVERIVAENGRERRFGYGSAGELASVTDLAGQTYRIVSDPETTTIEAPNGERVIFSGETDSYSIAYSDGQATRFVLSDRGDLIRQALPSGKNLDYEYDSYGRRVRSTDSSTGAVATYEWNEADELIRATNHLGATSYTYDSLGNLSRLQGPEGAEILYERDLLGRVTAVELRPPSTSSPSAARRVLYRYDRAGNLVEVVDPLVGPTRFEYNEVNRLVRRTLPNGIASEYTYDLRDRIVSLVHKDGSGAIIASFEYERGALGEPIRIRREDGSYVALGYDAALRLTREAYFANSGELQEEIIYSYDAAGNRLTRTDGGGMATYTYRPGFRLESVESPAALETYGYDLDGNVTSMQRDSRDWTFGLNAEGQLLSASERVGGASVSFGYDAERRRGHRQDGTRAHNFLMGSIFGGPDAVQMITDASGALSAGYIYAGPEVLMRYGVEGGEAFYLTDASGSVIALADANGTVTARFEYGAFGEVRASSGIGAPAGVGGDFRFHGGWLEERLDLYWFGQRLYDFETGRFLSRDPLGPVIEQPESVNPYLFANGNPALFRDPSGLFSLVTVNTDLSVQGILNTIRTLPARYLKKRIREKAEQWIGNAVSDALQMFLPIDFDIGKKILEWGEKVGDEIGGPAELGVRKGICTIIGDVRWAYFEPEIKETTGDIIKGKNGFKCPVSKDSKITMRGGHRYPDFYIARRPPDTHEGGLVLGEVKASISTFYYTWIKEHPTDKDKRKHYRREQLDAFAMHASKHLATRLMVLVAFNPAPKRENEMMLKELLVEIVNRGAIPIIVIVMSRMPKK